MVTHGLVHPLLTNETFYGARTNVPAKSNWYADHLSALWQNIR